MMWLTAVLVAATFWTAPPSQWSTSPNCQPLAQIPVHVIDLGVTDPDGTGPGAPIRVLGTLQRPAPGVCQVLIDEGRWPWWKLCSVLTHEYGHAMGFREEGNIHSRDQRSVMFPALWRQADNCVGKRPPGYSRGQRVLLTANAPEYSLPTAP